MITSMRAAILAVGSELLGTRRLDTNSLRLTEVLERFGIDLIGKAVVGDDVRRIADQMARLLASADLVLVTGGLGPTADDCTRAAAALACGGRPVTVDEGIVDHIRGLFASFGRTMPEVNRRQAEVIEGAEVLDNRRGTAPGQRLDHGGSTLFLFPGVPRELEPMIRHHLVPFIVEQLGGVEGEIPGLERRMLKVASLPESEVEERIAPVYERYGREAIAVLASPGEIKVYASARGLADERTARLGPMIEDLRRAIGTAVFTEDEGETLEARVGALLSEAGLTLVTAESCTGGLIGERMTRVPGSSGWYLGGAVTYTNALKHQLLGVPNGLFEEHGAVSEPVARAMAAGAKERLGADMAVAVTGVAGPGGGTETKPVGLVHLAVAGPGDGDILHRRAQFPGDRERVRSMTGQLALELVRRCLLESPRSPSTLN